jgi:hypothetical protein
MTLWQDQLFKLVCLAPTLQPPSDPHWPGVEWFRIAPPFGHASKTRTRELQRTDVGGLDAIPCWRLSWPNAAELIDRRRSWSSVCCSTRAPGRPVQGRPPSKTLEQEAGHATHAAPRHDVKFA